MGLRQLLTLLIIVSGFFAVVGVKPAHAVSLSIINHSGLTCSVSSTTQTASFLTDASNDLIIFAVDFNLPNSIINVAGGGLVWTPRNYVNTTVAGVSEYYAFSHFANSSSITVTFSSATNNCDLLDFVISGVPSLYYFDNTAQRTASGNSMLASTLDRVSYPNEMVIGLVDDDNGFAVTPNYPFQSVDPTSVIPYGIYSITTTVNVEFPVGASFNGSGPWRLLVDGICSSQCITGGGGSGPPGRFTSVSGPGGLAIPPQLADQGVIGFMFLLSAGIALGSIQIGPQKKKIDERARLG